MSECCCCIEDCDDVTSELDEKIANCNAALSMDLDKESTEKIEAKRTALRDKRSRLIAKKSYATVRIVKALMLGNIWLMTITMLLLTFAVLPLAAFVSLNLPRTADPVFISSTSPDYTPSDTMYWLSSSDATQVAIVSWIGGVAAGLLALHFVRVYGKASSLANKAISNETTANDDNKDACSECKESNT